MPHSRPVHFATAMPVCQEDVFQRSAFDILQGSAMDLNLIDEQQMMLEHQRLVQCCLVLHRFAPLHHNLKQSLRGEIQHHIPSTGVQLTQSIIQQVGHPRIGTVQ